MTEPRRAAHPVPEPRWPKVPPPLGMLFYVMGLSLVFALLTTVTTGGQPRTVPYTEFKQLLRSGQVATVTISEEGSRPSASRTRGWSRNSRHIR